MKKLLSIGLVGGVAVVSACFGDGPTPGAPTGATILATGTPGHPCNQGSYIGPVAFGSDHGFVSFLPYQSIGDNCGGGFQASQTVYSFLLG